MKKLCLLAGLFLLALSFSCTEQDKTGGTQLEGHVYFIGANATPQPVPGALVYIKNQFAQARTNADGAYSVALDPVESEFEAVIMASKVGFKDGQTTVYVQKDQTVQVPDITLEKVSSDSLFSPVDTLSSSGDASHIEVYGEHARHIYISGAGLQETAVVYFKVSDSRGVPVDDDHQVTVSFNILNGPDGGEYLYPSSMITDHGMVYTILNSGTVAGALQIEARFEQNGTTFRTLPVRLSIYGGLPDADHFSLALDKVNIAGRVHFGLLDGVTAFVGDKYSNPVAPGTAVYFSSDYAIVDGSAVTDEMGRATVNFMSAQPLPPDPGNNPFARITASTYSDTLAKHEIKAEATVLLSDVTAPILVSPESFTYTDLNKPVQFSYTVQDIWGNPIVGGSSIKVAATDGAVYGDVDVTMLDARGSGPGLTDYAFTWAPGDSLQAPLVYISITVQTPADGNGYRSVNIAGAKSAN